MKTSNIFLIPFLVIGLSILGLLLSVRFQGMAYWGQAGSLNMKWFWLGAAISYSVSLGSLYLVVFKWAKQKFNIINQTVRGLCQVVNIISVIITTMIIVAWQSGF